MTQERHEETVMAIDAQFPVRNLLDIRGYYQSHGKRAADVILVCAGLLIAAPLMLVVAVLVALDGGTPIFTHERIGLKGRRFQCFKFRTMRQDAAERLADLLERDPVAAKEWEMHHKLEKDPRITTTGRWLRATSLDEFPQFLNVIRGDMSMVGPRPVTEPELQKYGGQLSKYLALRPGITGIWQVHGRGDDNIDYSQRVEMDAHYFKTMSFIGDIVLMFQTIAVMFRQRGQ